MDLPSTGPGCSEVRFGAVGIWTVFLSCYVVSFVYDYPHCSWCCSLIFPAWILSGTALSPQPLLGSAISAWEALMLSSKPNLNSSFLQEKSALPVRN